MIVERRMTNTGSIVPAQARIPPEQMTDEQLQGKVCCKLRDACTGCAILYMCKYGKEYTRRGLGKAMEQKMIEKYKHRKRGGK